MEEFADKIDDKENNLSRNSVFLSANSNTVASGDHSIESEYISELQLDQVASLVKPTGGSTCSPPDVLVPTLGAAGPFDNETSLNTANKLNESTQIKANHMVPESHQPSSSSTIHPHKEWNNTPTNPFPPKQSSPRPASDAPSFQGSPNESAALACVSPPPIEGSELEKLAVPNGHYESLQPSTREGFICAESVSPLPANEVRRASLTPGARTPPSSALVFPTHTPQQVSSVSSVPSPVAPMHSAPQVCLPTHPTTNSPPH
eukprot:Platyproteum_vivax@DN14160_c0_g1_i1.p1